VNNVYDYRTWHILKSLDYFVVVFLAYFRFLALDALLAY
jgi:hypothetical protein